MDYFRVHGMSMIEQLFLLAAMAGNFKRWLYKLGNEFSTLTGGRQARAWTGNGGAPNAVGSNGTNNTGGGGGSGGGRSGGAGGTAIAIILNHR